MENLELVSVPVIVSAVVAILGLLKKFVKGNEKVLKFFPLIAAGLGAVLGIIAFYACPEIIPAASAWTAILIGGASGLAATGTHQVFKQLAKESDESEPKAEDLQDSADKSKEDSTDEEGGDETNAEH